MYIYVHLQKKWDILWYRTIINQGQNIPQKYGIIFLDTLNIVCLFSTIDCIRLSRLVTQPYFSMPTNDRYHYCIITCRCISPPHDISPHSPPLTHATTHSCHTVFLLTIPKCRKCQWSCYVLTTGGSEIKLLHGGVSEIQLLHCG